MQYIEAENICGAYICVVDSIVQERIFRTCLTQTLKKKIFACFSVGKKIAFFTKHASKILNIKAKVRRISIGLPSRLEKRFVIWSVCVCHPSCCQETHNMEFKSELLVQLYFRYSFPQGFME